MSRGGRVVTASLDPYLRCLTPPRPYTIDSYLYVITRREHSGDFLHASKPVYRCTGVLAIPLHSAGAESVMRAEMERVRTDGDGDSDSKDSSKTIKGGHPDGKEGRVSEESEGDDVVTPSITRSGSFMSGTDNAANQRSATLTPAEAAKWRSGSTARSVSESHSHNSSHQEGAPPQPHLGEQGTVGTDEPVAVPDLAPQGSSSTSSDSSPPLSEREANRLELEDKLVKEAARQYARGEMFFSYDFDLTTPLQRKYNAVIQSGASASAQPHLAAPFEEPRATLPLWRRVDRRFWHNEHMVADFVGAGLHSMVLPLMQGYFQVATIRLPGGANGRDEGARGDDDESDDSDADGDNDAETTSTLTAQLLIVSRRSRERPGLRYQRRGINDLGQVANYVETEQILFVRRSAQTHLFSFTQFRGSIPLYWSQSPFALKPPPLLERSPAENAAACARHFAAQTQIHGRVHCVNLAEQAGKEGEITAAYEQAAQKVKKEESLPVEYEAFDFHRECKGMKFENVARLTARLEGTLKEMGCFHRVWGQPPASGDKKPSGGAKAGNEQKSASGASATQVLSQQKGIFRVSCLDCLDRTNVVQSAFGRHMLLAQLARMGIGSGEGQGAVESKTDSGTDNVAPPAAAAPSDADVATASAPAAPPPLASLPPDSDFTFNDLWANNGDQVSQCYAGSRALKGDFTRTGKRNFLGMMNDATASVYRMVQGAVSDFWRQAVISFTYGELGLHGLERYTDELEAADPSRETRLARVRAEAIETCAALVLGTDTSTAAGAAAAGEERLVGGWTLFSPVQHNTVRAPKLDEKILLLTSRALYLCAYDFTAETLSEYSRVLLGDVVRIQRGKYVISPREGNYDEAQHWGLVVYFLRHATRVNTNSVRNVPAAATAAAVASAEKSTQDQPQDDAAEAHAGGEVNFVALKAIADDFAGTLDVDDVDADAVAAGSGPGGGGSKGGKGSKTHAAASPSPAEVTASRVTTASARARARARSGASNDDEGELTSRAIVDVIVRLLVRGCAAAGACEEGADARPEGEGEATAEREGRKAAGGQGQGSAGEKKGDAGEKEKASEKETDAERPFVEDKTIQSLAEARANAPLFAGLIEGLKRRLWL